MILGLVVLGAIPRQSAGQVFLPDDPLTEDPDRLDMPPPRPWSIGDYYDFWINTFGTPAEYEGPALNVNTLGEVPNSSWYTNRHYHRRLAFGELRAGPGSGRGPSEKGPWKVVSGKTEGKTAGLEIVDAIGERYLLKFDPPEFIELASGAEAVATRLLHALGYNVPENNAITFERERLVAATKEDLAAIGEEDADDRITEELVDELLTQAARYPDGRLRALASKFIEGKPLGPFLYYGTRPDDANDVFPHESRRELRGLRLIAAWINHTDTRAPNTLDVLVEENGRRFVRHHLIDFGSTFGAGSVGLRPRWDSFEYAIQFGSILKRALSLGIAGLHWAAIEYDNPPAVGRLDIRHFDPEKWRPLYPNAAFRRMDAADAFWAARQIMHFTEKELRAVIEAGHYSDPAAADRLLELLMGRRERIGRRYLDFAGGLDRFAVVDGLLTFVDLPVKHGFASADRPKTASWYAFENHTGVRTMLGAPTPLVGTEVRIPESDSDYLALDIAVKQRGVTTVYIRRVRSTWEVVGVERAAAVNVRD